ncbi:MAG TPA: hypothetical protein VLF88_02975 [Candidatus Babeliales bacterium]|nr:hypothetical protein [Candidatus Babeliales bacterium]
MGEMKNKMTGKSKKMAGKMSNDKKLQAKGKAQEEMGNFQGNFQ